MRPQLINSATVGPSVTVTRKTLHEMAVLFGEEATPVSDRIPFMWIMSDGSRLIWVETPWSDEAEKAATAKLMRKLMRRLHVTAYAFISEVWMTSPNVVPEEERAAFWAQIGENGVNGLPPTLRDEALLVTSFDKEGGVGISQFLITPRRDGRLLGPRVDVEPDADAFGGRLWNLLK